MNRAVMGNTILRKRPSGQSSSSRKSETATRSVNPNLDVPVCTAGGAREKEERTNGKRENENTNNTRTGDEKEEEESEKRKQKRTDKERSPGSVKEHRIVRSNSQRRCSDSALRETESIQDDQDEMADAKRFPARHHRSKSIMVRKTQPKTDTGTSKQGSSSVRLRRASDSPASAAGSSQNPSQSGGAGTGGLELSMAQINMVRKLWQHVRVQGENGPGLAILRQHMFFRCPSARQLFSTDLTEGTESEVCYHKRLMTHAEVISDLLDELINNLDRAQVVKEKLKKWGALHAHMRQIGFTAAIFDRFAESLNDCTLTWCQKAQRCFDAQVAWTTIALYMSEQLKDGYYEETRKLRRQQYPSLKNREDKPKRKESGANCSTREEEKGRGQEQESVQYDSDFGTMI